MSAIITESIFQSNSEQTKTQLYTQNNLYHCLLQVLEALKLQKNRLILKIIDYQKTQYIYEIGANKNSFLLKIVLNIKKQNINLVLTLLNINKLLSLLNHQQSMLILKQINNSEQKLPPEATVFIINHSFYLTSKIIFTFDKAFNKLSLISYLKQSIVFYTHVYQQILQKFQCFFQPWLYNTRYHRQYQNLVYTRTLSVIDRLQHQEGHQQFQLQQCCFDQLFSIIKEETSILQTTEDLFQNQPKLVSKDILSSLKDYYTKEQKNLKHNSQTYNSLQKKLEDFLYNMIKVDLKQLLGNGERIAQGGSSQIFVARAQIIYISSSDYQIYQMPGVKQQRILAIKKIHKAKQIRHLFKLEHEQQIARKLRCSICPFINKYFETKTDIPFLKNALLMQYVNGEDLQFFLESTKETLSFWSKIYILMNITQGIRHLLRHNIVHLDLKPANILISKLLIPKIIDLGEAYNAQLCDKSYLPGFTFPYVAPETYINHLKQTYRKNQASIKFNEKQDVFAFGIIIAEVLFNDNLFHLNNEKLKEIYVRKIYIDRIMMAPQSAQILGDPIIQKTLIGLISECLDPEPQRRPSFKCIYLIFRYIFNFYNKNN